MKKFEKFIFWGIIIFFGITIIFLWPTKSRMTEFCSDKLYGYPDQIKKYTLNSRNNDKLFEDLHLIKKNLIRYFNTSKNKKNLYQYFTKF